MSESSIAKKIASAYRKAGKILGRNFNVYRSVQLNDSLSDANFIAEQYSAFTLTTNFVSPQTEGFKTYIAYTDYSKIEVGDIFSDDGETFVIVWSRGIEDPVAIRATDIVEIYSAGWETTNGLQQTRTRIAKNVPASITKASSTSDVVLNNVQNPSQANRYEVRIWSPTNNIKQTDNIILADGTILRIDSLSSSELTQILLCTEVSV